MERTGAQPDEIGEVGAGPQFCSEIARQGPDVGPFRAIDEQGRDGRVPLQHLQAGERHGSRRARDLLTAARQIVELLATDLDRGVHRGYLLAGAAKARQHRFDSVRGQLRGTGDTGDTTLDIVAVGLDAEGHVGQVGLGGVVEEFQRLRGHANRERQHPGRGRIEGTGVADPLFT